MKIVKIISIAIIAIVICIAFCFHGLMIKIEAGQTGVRTKQYALFGAQGLEPKDFSPGWHRSLPIIDTWVVFDSTVQTTDFTTAAQREIERSILDTLRQSGSQGDAYGLPAGESKMIKVVSKDGNPISLDVTVKYRPKPGEVYQVYENYATEQGYKKFTRDQIQLAIRGVFGELKTEEFYHPQQRREKTELVMKNLTQELASRHIELIHILIRDISFEKAYERKILDKKLADQEVELNKSKTAREERLGETNKIKAKADADVAVIERETEAELVKMKAETDKEIAQITADANLKVAKIKAAADLYAAEQVAKGDLMEKEAEAAGELLKAAALKGPGGANYVALQAIGQIQIGNISVSTLGTDFLDVETMVEKFGAVKAE